MMMMAGAADTSAYGRMHDARMDCDGNEDIEEDFLSATAPLVFGNIQARVEIGANKLEIGFPIQRSRNRIACAMTEFLPERDAVVDVSFGPEDFGLWLAVALESEVRFYTGVDSLMAIPSKIGWHLSSRIVINALKRDADEGAQIKSVHWQPWGFVPAIVIGMDTGKAVVYAWDARIGSWTQTSCLTQESENEVINVRWAPCPGSVELGAKHSVAILTNTSVQVFEFLPPGVQISDEQTGGDESDHAPKQVFQDDFEDRIDESSSVQWNQFGSEFTIADANNEIIKTYVMNIQGEWNEK